MNMPSHDCPEDDDVRQSYNFAPGYHGLVYRADAPDHGFRAKQKDGDGNDNGDEDAVKEEPEAEEPTEKTGEVHYKLQAMKWGSSPVLHSCSKLIISIQASSRFGPSAHPTTDQ